MVPVLKDAVQRAYLACAEYADTGVKTVVLCLRATGPEEPLVKNIGGVFAQMFGTNQHLDIIFLNHEQDRKLGERFQPFFESVS